MNKTSSRFLTGFKYVYLIAFFTLLAGFFHPLITDTGFDREIMGVVVLFIGLVGGVLLYKSATLERRKEIFLGGGFALVAISLYYIFEISHRL